MNKYLVTWVDGHRLAVDAENGTDAKAIARTTRGVKKSECKIARVEPLKAARSSQAADPSSAPA